MMINYLIFVGCLYEVGRRNKLLHVNDFPKTYILIDVKQRNADRGKLTRVFIQSNAIGDMEYENIFKSIMSRSKSIS